MQASATMAASIAPRQVCFRHGARTPSQAMALPSLRTFRLATLAGMLWLMAQMALADAYSDVQRLISNQQWAKAQTQIDQHLKVRPQDPQMRLLLSRVQEGQGQTDAAMATLLELTQAYPELPEPHNNLAAVYVRARRYDEALASLKRAILARPDYALALENLGDLHAALAKQAYERAAQATVGIARSQSKAQAIGQMLQTDAR